MSIMFCDIRSFTSLVEAKTPDEAFRFVNSFTQWMEPAIHQEGGFINQYLGDCIMALFPAGSDAAVRAGIGMLASIDGFNRNPLPGLEGGPTVRIGIGVNAGPLMVGTIGGSERLSHAVIGDAVNVAARVESLTKLYGATFLISGPAHDELADASAYRLRLLDRVLVKGRSEPIAIWEVLDGLDAEVRERKLAIREHFAKARLAYESRSFALAESLFAECLARAPEDLASKLYIERCRKLGAEGVPPGWRGETVMAEE
jgi:two-component system sensor histidine kinase ChiS